MGIHIAARFVCVGVVVCLGFLLPARLLAAASLIGEASNTWYYGYFGQMGSNGFFGPYDVDATGQLALNCAVPGGSGRCPSAYNMPEG